MDDPFEPSTNQSFFLFFCSTGGPYAAFGGRDASRGLATFSVTSNDAAEWDDLSDLSPMEMESVREWEMQFKGKGSFISFLFLFLIGLLIKFPLCLFFQKSTS